MIAQRIEILDQLAKQGWEATPLGELEWWADEMWLLVSKWSPVGSQAYLTFIVDPLRYSPDRKKGEGVWAAMVSGGKPVDRYASGDSSEISLNQGWKERLPELLEYLSGLRNKRGAESMIDGS